MCVSSNLRCGSCLAKWNGKAWEELYKCVLPLKSWTVVLNKELKLCVEGQCDVNFDLTVCVPITDVLNSYWIISERTLLKLRGVLDTQNIPDFIAKKFSNGFPSEWKKIGDKWLEYIRRGKSDIFNWTQDESFGSSDTTILLANVEEHLSSGTRGKIQEKSAQNKLQELSRANEPDKDLAMPPIRGQETNVDNSMNWCPWLPAHKVQEICKWVDHAEVAPNPLVDMEIENEISSVNPSDSASFVNKKHKEQRVQFSETVVQNPRNIVPQSTPQSNINASRVLQTLDFDLSAIAKASDVTNISSTSDHVEDVFRKPRIALPGGKVANSKGNSKSASEGRSNILQTQSVTSSKSSIAEIPGSKMTKMLSNPYRRLKKRSLLKIERWRPVLGVDGQLIIQGYLLLNADVTAGQILTTNPVVQWGYRKVETNDGKEYELVGEPYENISDDLRSRLLKPISCEEIISKLREYQALKDRSDWGAEYEVFYGNDSAYDTGSSRISQSSKSNKRSRTASKMSSSDTIGPTSACEITKATEIPETPKSVPNMKLRGSSNFKVHDSSSECESGSPTMSSPVRKSSRITERKKLGKYQSWKNRMNMRRCVNKQDGTESLSDKSRYISENNHKDGVEIPRKDNTPSSAGVTRLCFENVTWKGSENQMMRPSLGLTSDSSVVHFSPSRIKVSYLNNTTNTADKAIQNILQNSSGKRSRLDEWIEDSFTRVPLHTPVSLSRLQNSDSSTISSSPQCSPPLCSPSLGSHVYRCPKTVKVNTSVRISSQSPVSRTKTQESSVRRNSSAPASLFHKTSKSHSDKITANKLSHTLTANKTPTDVSTKPILRIPATKTPAKTATITPKTRTGSRTSTKTETKTPTTKTPATKTPATKTPATKTPATKTPATKTPATKTPATKTPATKIPDSTTSGSESSANKVIVSHSLTSKTPVAKSVSKKTPATSSCTSRALIPETSHTNSVMNNNSSTVSHKGPNVKTRGSKAPTTQTSASKTPTTRISASKTPTTRTSASKTPTTRTSASKTPSIRTSARKTHSTRAVKTPVTQISTAKTPASCSSSSKTPASKQPCLSMTNSSRSSGRAKGSKIKEPWVVLPRLNIKHDHPNNYESGEEVTISNKTRKKSATKMVKSMKIESTNTVIKKGKENSRNKTAKTIEKKTSKTKTLKKKRKGSEKERFSSTPNENENNADDNASVCSNLSDMSVGPSASVIFAMDSPTSRRAPRTLKERREMDERLKQMEKHLSNKEGAADVNTDDDPMANLISSYQFTELPPEWCRHENLLGQSRKRRRPSSSDGTTPPHSAFDDGFGNEDATSSVATPQLLMRPPDPKQVQSYLQRQRALNSRPQRPTRQARKDKDYMLPDIDYSAAFRSEFSDSEESSVVSNGDWV